LVGYAHIWEPALVLAPQERAAQLRTEADIQLQAEGALKTALDVDGH